ncbi:hypothetical protein [Acinetobacter baumannii]|uniref:hypothetical protein n=1 Tax=Acinetobacter baumannii TaxID=470 RepID=UPI00244D3993|nr:hypothetical protein [Acinetobacter baumannii]MDG9795317.1 hypothetical protein [Acinetobacter baumannii]
MDKQREGFEKAYEPNPNKSPFTEVKFDEVARVYKPLDQFNPRIASSLNAAWYGWRIRQAEVDGLQAKVEELKATIKGNHGRIAELERLNRVKAQAIIDLHQEITELKASHHGEVIGHEVHFKKIKQERDELQTLYTQQGINMLKMQKRVDALSKRLSEATGLVVEELEQALKGDQYDEHRKKAEEAISKGASLTNHRIEL